VLFEVKIRVDSNLDRIEKDLKKLTYFYSKNKECINYMVILDRKTSRGNRKKINKLIKKYKNIRIFPRALICEN